MFQDQHADTASKLSTRRNVLSNPSLILVDIPPVSLSGFVQESLREEGVEVKATDQVQTNMIRLWAASRALP